MEHKNIIVAPPFLVNPIFGDLHLHALEAYPVDAFSDYDSWYAWNISIIYQKDTEMILSSNLSSISNHWI